ncbi:sensor histidine kinase [Sulfitobacter sabulilitoris]|uniref:histidine kinase n=1 Tax=Sulfitobacter sabulilitoris TaxID=2562655 RepID=A0A5S3PJF7_9RHOB|nr:ATP-binding protein [Sulfitobacter sabulilitoris]TMM54396.1 cell wall metabolism sensor histidine kinase WalK [Sulfitobacter sabulilitoris]
MTAATDGKHIGFKIVPMLAFLIFLGAATVWVMSFLTVRAVEHNAAIRSVEWAEFAVRHAPQIEAVAEGLPLKSEEWKLFEDLISISGVFRFKIFSPEGQLRYISGEGSEATADLDAHNPHAANVVASGRTLTIVEDGRSKQDRPDLYSETYIPVYNGDRLVAIAETYLDQTEKSAAVRAEYTLVAVIMTGMIVFALSAPLAGIWLLFRRLRIQNAELEIERLRATAADKSKSEFLSTVSHELRTPLTSIKGSLDMLKSGRVADMPGAADRLVAMAARNTATLHLLVNDLLDFEKINSGNLEIHKSPTDLVAVVNDEIDTLETYGPDQDIEFVFTCDNDALVADADPIRIGQVVRNLLSNAVKFSPRGGKIVVSVFENNGSVRVTVEDSGCGIQQGDLERIFEKFTQVDSTDSRKHGGTGLGLAISREIVKKHDGDIGVTSVVGEGSIFYFDLPSALLHKSLNDRPAHVPELRYPKVSVTGMPRAV